MSRYSITCTLHVLYLNLHCPIKFYSSYMYLELFQELRAEQLLPEVIAPLHYHWHKFYDTTKLRTLLTIAKHLHVHALSHHWSMIAPSAAMHPILFLNSVKNWDWAHADMRSAHYVHLYTLYAITALHVWKDTPIWNVSIRWIGLYSSSLLLPRLLHCRGCVGSKENS